MQEAVIAIDAQGQVSWCNAVMQRIALSPVQEGRALVHSIRDPEVLSSVAAALTQRKASRRRAISVAPGKVSATGRRQAGVVRDAAHGLGRWGCACMTN